VHVAEVFNPWDDWHIANAERSRLAGEIAALAAPWVMPLVMLLAGVGAAYSLRARSNGAYIRERASRLLVPLAVGVLTFGFALPPATFYVFLVPTTLAYLLAVAVGTRRFHGGNDEGPQR
jgi:hypothetical protein